MVGPLSGIRVLDFTRHQQGPYATSLLADMGAAVIKVEPRLDGEWGRQSERDENGFSAYFESYNRGKQSITLDIRRPEGREVVLRLVPRVDVLVENFRPGYMNRVGPGYDHIAQAVGGLMIEQAGGPGHDPIPALPGAADQISATMFAFGIASALVARDRNGAGQKVEVSLLGSIIAFQGRQITRFLYTGKQGRARWRRSPLYSHYRASDGWVAIAAQDTKRWARLCAALEHPELIDDPRFAGPWDRHHNAEELESVLEQIFATRTAAEWLERLVAEDLPCAPVNDYRALIEGENLPAQLDANGYLATVEHPDLGTLRTAGIPIQMSGTPPGPAGHSPELGQQTEAVLLELGYTWEQMEQLRRDEVI
ncbi:MAG: CaiB/BaiF CoA transferase family protein [Dehalococcoidia bacterium]